jgi:hypothetical protein
MSASRRSASRYLPDDAADVAVLRVLWQLAQGMVWPWLTRDVGEAEAVRRATRRWWLRRSASTSATT